uniref:Activating transcription factor 7 interacting protein n=1 Tax=Labrus bergylta TaxID=56723 RepID=A0A3Q3G3D9_9LABR
MEVVVAEEKKKIFRARKTMKISDRQQLESLHSTLITATPGLSETSSPPLLNGMHKEDGPKAGDKEQNNVSDSNSPRTASPSSPTLSSPAPFLSLNLSPSPASSQSPPVKKERKEKGSASEEKMEVKVETKKKKTETTNSARGERIHLWTEAHIIRGDENDGQAVKREGKRPKVEREELEAQLELKITANAAGHHKLEQIVQQLVDERLRVLEMTIFDKHFEELKTRVDKIDCATKHQTAINTLQAKIARLAKKFGEANQASENKRKNEALAAAAAAANAANAAKTTTVSTNPQAPILQLITSTSNAASSLAAGITTQSPTGTLLLKTASGSSMMTTGQPLLIQLPLSMANGQAGTLVNIPVSSLTAANSLTKAKTTSSTATFILKPASAITTAAVSASTVATVPALQAGQMSSTQISLARAVYQGGAGGIMTPNAGVSVTTARTSSQSVSVAGAMSSASSPATSGPAATGSTAPGPPQGTSLTSKTDNQASGSTPSKAAPPAGRPKGSVIDLTEDDDDVQVTGVKNATPAAASPSQRPTPVISIPMTRTAPTTPSRNPNLPPLPAAPAPPRLPPEAERTSPPQQPQLKLVPSQTGGIVLSWCVAETDQTCATVDSYHLYAFHQDNSSSNAAQQHWKKIGEVNALPLPMACTLTQFQSGSTYHFAVRAKDIYGRFGSFCEPQCTNVITANSS